MSQCEKDKQMELGQFVKLLIIRKCIGTTSTAAGTTRKIMYI